MATNWPAEIAIAFPLFSTETGPKQQGPSRWGKENEKSRKWSCVLVFFGIGSNCKNELDIKVTADRKGIPLSL